MEPFAARQMAQQQAAEQLLVRQRNEQEQLKQHMQNNWQNMKPDSLQQCVAEMQARHAQERQQMEQAFAGNPQGIWPLNNIQSSPATTVQPCAQGQAGQHQTPIDLRQNQILAQQAEQLGEQKGPNRRELESSDKGNFEGGDEVMLSEEELKLQAQRERDALLAIQRENGEVSRNAVMAHLSEEERKVRSEAIRNAVVGMPAEQLPADLGDFVTPLEAWKYENRREAQEIVRDLFIGPYGIGRSEEELSKLGVTHVVIIRGPEEVNVLRAKFPDRFRYMTLEARDERTENILRYFNPCCEFIESGISTGGKVFVFEYECVGMMVPIFDSFQSISGISRVAAIVGAYLVRKYNMTCEEALQYVQARRGCCFPNEGFIRQLREYETIWRAQVMVQKQHELQK